MNQFRAFVRSLSLAPETPFSFNPYSGKDEAAKKRRFNLTLYLTRMAGRQPQVLLLGEAPGYRGCRVTGIPFTSESVLQESPSPFGLFQASAGFRYSSEPETPCREATATILWQTLVKLNALPLLWNAYPFHPHQLHSSRSNRPPTGEELAIGRGVLCALLNLYSIEFVIPVGNRADQALRKWGIASREKVRHPARGGKEAFRRELTDAFARAGFSNSLAPQGSNDEK